MDQPENTLHKAPSTASDAETIRARLLLEANELPLSPGVYIMCDKNDKVIYVGKSKKLKNRVSQYFQLGEKNQKTARMVSLVRRFETILCDTEIEALSLENSLIKQYAPKYNIRLKDAKSYPYIKLTAEEYPRLVFTRKREKDRAKYFGPYSSSGTAYRVIDALRRILRLPSCKHTFPRDIGRVRPCLYYQMGRCCGVCTGKVSREEYLGIVRYAADIMRGNTSLVREELEKEMLRYAELEQFEMAAKYRDTLFALDSLREKQRVVASPGTERDVFGFYADEIAPTLSGMLIRDGRVVDLVDFVFNSDEITESSALVTFLSDYYRKSEYVPRTILLSFDPGEEERELLTEYLSALAGRRITVRIPERGEGLKLCSLATLNAKERANKHRSDAEKDDSTLWRLAELLCLETVPERIEAYDISNLGTEHKTAGMIVCKNGRLSRSDYRSFSIRDIEGTDDYASMAEALRRRLSHLNDAEGSFSEYPDLILLDGGRGHVSTVKAVMREMGLEIPVFGMVKDDYHKTRALTTEDCEINIAKENRIFLLIYKIQEEVHRYSVSRMHQSKQKTVKHSSLEKIPGIGEKKAEKLLREFGGLRRLKTASLEEIAAVKGISKKDAETVYSYYRKDD